MTTAESQHRKLTAILAADVVGYSRLIGADEEGTLRRLTALRAELIEPAIAARRGRLFHTAGDSILIEFGSVVDAARCAMAIQHALAERNGGTTADRRIDFRIGIHLGDVVVERDGNLLGDGVNIAARLEGIAAPGGIAMSHAAYEQVRDKIDAALADWGEMELKNIARPVRVYAISTSNDATPAQAGVHRADTQRSTGVDPGFRRGGEKNDSQDKHAPRLSIVVLPFANLGGDPEQDYFADGVTDSLTTDLSRIAGSFVIARNTAFTYKDKHADVKQIGRDLNIRYALEGSVQRGGDRLRVNVQLIDAGTGHHLWAERFDKPVADLFDMQDEIVARLANRLSAELIAAEAQRAAHSPHPDSMDLYFQGMASFHCGFTPENVAASYAFFDRALTLDPDNVQALTWKAWIDLGLIASGMTGDRTALIARAEDALSRALSLAPDHPFAHCCLGLLRILTNLPNEGIAECRRALALDHNLAVAHAYIGLAGVPAGRAQDTELHVIEALRFSPRDINAFAWMTIAGVGKLCIGEDEAAAAWLRRAIETNPNYALSHFYLAAALAHLGRNAPAHEATRAGLALDPAFTARRWREVVVNPTDDPVVMTQRDRIVEGMIEAGIPTG